MTIANIFRRKRPVWSNPAPTRWVATSRGNYSGEVERNHLGFRVTNETGTYIGFAQDLEDAQAILIHAAREAETDANRWTRRQPPQPSRSRP
jgi:hypothetical protein